MKWTGVEVARDARRYAKARLNYGRGAGIERRNIMLELRPKMKDPAYAEAFQNELKNLDDGKIFKQIQTRKKLENAVKTGKKAYRGANKLYHLWQRIKPYISEVLG